MKLKLGQWSVKHACCIMCGTTESRHAGHGLCRRCDEHAKLLRVNPNARRYLKDRPQVESPPVRCVVDLPLLGEAYVLGRYELDNELVADVRMVKSGRMIHGIVLP